MARTVFFFAMVCKLPAWSIQAPIKWIQALFLRMYNCQSVKQITHLCPVLWFRMRELPPWHGA
jgi:hypothetical protein